VQSGNSLEKRREDIAALSDEELKERFWELAREIVTPLHDLAYNHTSPSIERSVLLRMGFSSIESEAIVSRAVRFGLLGKGAGHLVLKYASIIQGDYVAAGRALGADESWDALLAAFRGEGGR